MDRVPGTELLLGGVSGCDSRVVCEVCALCRVESCARISRCNGRMGRHHTSRTSAAIERAAVGVAVSIAVVAAAVAVSVVASAAIERADVAGTVAVANGRRRGRRCERCYRACRIEPDSTIERAIGCAASSHAGCAANQQPPPSLEVAITGIERTAGWRRHPMRRHERRRARPS